MNKAYAQLQKQIAKLQQEAEAIRAKEVAGVIGRIQEAIKHYGLTTEDLFPKAATKSAKASNAAAKPKAPKKAPAAAKYTDGVGKTWNGIGKRPGWFVWALAAGKTAKDLEIGASKA
jgi:DNA-binding protein H-NS